MSQIAFNVENSLSLAGTLIIKGSGIPVSAAAVGTLYLDTATGIFWIRGASSWSTALSLKADASALTLKADTTTVNTALALKADITSVNSSLALKADTAIINTALALKADIQTMNDALALKADLNGTSSTRRGLTSAVTAILNAIAWADGDTTPFVPAGNYNPTTYAQLVTALQSATSGQRIRIPPKTSITITAQLPNVPIGVTLIGGGAVQFINGYVPASPSDPNSCMLPMLSGAEGTNGNQTIENIAFFGNNYQATSAIYVRARSNVKIINCTAHEFNYNFVTFNGRANEVDGPATIKATGNGVYNCSSTACCTWIGAKPGGYASGIVQYGSQIGFELRATILIAKGRGSTNNGYCFKYYRNGYNDGASIDNCTLRKSCDDGTPSNFMFCGEIWHDTGFTVRNSFFEGWFDLNGLTKGSYQYGYEFTNNVFGTLTVPTNTTTAAIELELGLVGNPSSDGLVQNNLFRNIRNAMYVYQKSGTGTDKFSNLTFRNNKCLNTRFGEFVAAVTSEGGTANWKITNNTFRRLGSASAMNAGIMLPGFGNNSDWIIKHNIISGFSTAPVLQNAPVGVTSNVTLTDNIFNGNTSNNPSWSVTPTNYTVARNATTDPLFDVDDGTSMRNAYSGTVGADEYVGLVELI